MGFCIHVFCVMVQRARSSTLPDPALPYTPLVRSAVARLSPGGAQPLVGNFLALLADNRRLVLLPEIAGLYEELRADAERVVKARGTSATDLPAGELDA